MSRYFGKDGAPLQLMEWARLMEDEEYKRVGSESRGDVLVSTVWLGLDHSFGQGPPIIFETLIFGGEHDEYTKRYSTEDQAREGHDRIVAKLRAGKKP